MQRRCLLPSTSRNACRTSRKEEVNYSLQDAKTIPSLNGPDQRLKWSTIKQGYQHLKNFDLLDTDTGPVQLIIGTNNSDLILPKEILKPSGQPQLYRVPYAVETPLGWAVTNWLPVERRVASPYSGFKVYERSSVQDEELKPAGHGLVRDRNVGRGQAS